MENVIKLKELGLRINFIHEEINLIKSRIQPQDCGHLKTAVSVLNERLKELVRELKEFES